MKDTMWISKIEYEHYIANELKNTACANMKNGAYLKDHITLSASAIHDIKE